MVSPRPSAIRKRILKQRGVELKKHSRRPTHVADLPSPYTKTKHMQLVEHQQSQRLEHLIYKGTIYVVGRRLGISPSTVSKWRKVIDAAFFQQFNEGEK